jgi:hypothetical protein
MTDARWHRVTAASSIVFSACAIAFAWIAAWGSSWYWAAVVCYMLMGWWCALAASRCRPSRWEAHHVGWQGAYGWTFVVSRRGTSDPDVTVHTAYDDRVGDAEQLAKRIAHGLNTC